MRPSLLVLAIPGLALLAACGGSGGGGSSEPFALSLVALEGQPTPAGGTFQGFSPVARLSAATGGWVAFLGGVSGGSTSQGLFVSRPDGNLTLVYAIGEAVPGGTGTIDAFERIWMRPGGIVVALVQVNGASSRGFVTARVTTGGSVVEKSGALYYGASLPDTTSPGTAGTLADIDEAHVEVDDQGSLFFLGAGSNGLTGIWFVNRAGQNLADLAIQGTPAPGGGSFGAAFEALGIDSQGQIVAFAADVGGVMGVYSVASAGTYLKVAADGGGVTSVPGRLIEDVVAGGPLVVRFDGTLGTVTWLADMTGTAPDDAVLTRPVVEGGASSLGALDSVVAPGESLPSTSGGLEAGVRLLPCAPGVARWPLVVAVVGGVTTRVYYSETDATSALTEFWRQGGIAPGGGAWGTNYPSLTLSAPTDGYDAASLDGSIGFSAVLADATSGVYWANVNFSSAILLVAKEGAAAPDTGGTFAPFLAPSAVTAADGVLAFRAVVTGGSGATGLFVYR